MKPKVIAYWIGTALLSFSFVMGGASQVMRSPQAVEGIATHLGYPVYFVVLLGVWKVLGGIAILLPRTALLKEWAYAGIVFDLTGAAVSHAAVGSDAQHIVTTVGLTLLAVASWALRPESRKLKAAEG